MSHTVASHVCITLTQMRQKVLLRLNMCCAFLQCEQYKVIKSTEEVFFFFFLQLTWEKDIILNLWPMHQLHFLLSAHFRREVVLFPNTQWAASTVLQGWSLGREGRGSVTRQVDRNLPISCSQLFHLSGKPSVKKNATQSPSAWSDMNTLSKLVGEWM